MNIIVKIYRAANSMVEYSAFNRFVPGSIPGQPRKIKAKDSKNHFTLSNKNELHYTT